MYGNCFLKAQSSRPIISVSLYMFRYIAFAFFIACFEQIKRVFYVFSLVGDANYLTPHVVGDAL